jgi:predicted aspartyl protease
MVNGRPLRLILDTGASMSLIYTSQALACGIEGMIDRRPVCRIVFSAVDAQTRPSVGIIHAVPMSIGAWTSTAKFAVMDGDEQRGLLGIDWLLENAAVIDVVNDCMRVGDKIVYFQDSRPRQ